MSPLWPERWWEIAFLAIIPGLLLVVCFGWLVYLARGRRAVRFTLSGLGLRLTLDSAEHRVMEDFPTE